MAVSSVNTLTVEMDIAMRVQKSVMERTLDTRRVIHTFQGHMVTSSAHRIVSLIPLTANSSHEEEFAVPGRCNGIQSCVTTQHRNIIKQKKNNQTTSSKLSRKRQPMAIRKA